MDRIRRLYRALTKSEVRYLKASLKAFHTKGENRSLKLIEYLEKAPDIGNADMAELLYGDPRSKAFIMLKSRLLERMMEVMTLSVNLNNNQVVKEDPSHMAIINMQKMLSYAVLMRIRGLYDLARDLLEKTRQMAREHGNPEIEVQCIAHLCNLSTSLEEVNEQHRPDMADALETYRSDLMGLGLMAEYRLMARGDRLTDDHQFADFLDKQADDLEHRLSVHPSLRARAYLLTLRGVIHQLRGNFDACQSVIHDRLELYQTNPGLSNKYRMGGLYFQLADMEARALRFTEAIAAAEQVRGAFPPSKPNYFKGSILLIFARLYQGDLAEAKDVIEELQTLKSYAYTQQLMPVVSYLEACWYYLKGECRSTCQLLAADQGLTQDKSGWNVGIRLFELMTLLEMKKYELAETKVETLRKHIARHGADPRNQIIFRLLHQASRYHFDFTQINGKLEEALAELRQTTWSALSHEVVRFETWIKAYTLCMPYLQVMQQELKGASA